MGPASPLRKSLSFLFFLLLLFLSADFFSCLTPEAHGREYWLRVELGSLVDIEELVFAFPLFLEIDNNGRELMVEEELKIRAAKGRLFLRTAGGLRFDGVQSLLVSSPAGSVEIEGGSWRGEYPGYLEIYPQEDLLQIINRVNLEDYTAAVLGQEMPLFWEEEALKAQAVLIRTFAVHGSGAHKGFDFCSTTHCQVYKGLTSSMERAAEIALATEGLVLGCNGRAVPVFYHSACGGILSSPQDVWGETNEYTAHFREGSCKWAGEILCRQSPYFAWQREMDFFQWQKFCSAFMGREIFLGPEDFEYTPGGRIKAVLALGKRRSFLDFWSLVTDVLGWGYWPSNLFTINFQSEGVEFVGKGLGHGVGMCQWGAKALAEQGYNFADILSFYFPGAQVFAREDIS